MHTGAGGIWVVVLGVAESQQLAVGVNRNGPLLLGALVSCTQPSSKLPERCVMRPLRVTVVSVMPVFLKPCWVRCGRWAAVGEWLG